MHSDSTPKIRRHQLAETVRGEGHAAFDPAWTCICGHDRTEHLEVGEPGADGCHHVFDAGRPGSAMCGCDEFIAGKRVP